MINEYRERALVNQLKIQIATTQVANIASYLDAEWLSEQAFLKRERYLKTKKDRMVVASALINRAFEKGTFRVAFPQGRPKKQRNKLKFLTNGTIRQYPDITYKGLKSDLRKLAPLLQADLSTGVDNVRPLISLINSQNVYIYLHDHIPENIKTYDLAYVKRAYNRYRFSSTQGVTWQKFFARYRSRETGSKTSFNKQAISHVPNSTTNTPYHGTPRAKTGRGYSKHRAQSPEQIEAQLTIANEIKRQFPSSRIGGALNWNYLGRTYVFDENEAAYYHALDGSVDVNKWVPGMIVGGKIYKRVWVRIVPIDELVPICLYWLKHVQTFQTGSNEFTSWNDVFRRPSNIARLYNLMAESYYKHHAAHAPEGYFDRKKRPYHEKRTNSGIYNSAYGSSYTSTQQQKQPAKAAEPIAQVVLQAVSSQPAAEVLNADSEENKGTSEGDSMADKREYQYSNTAYRKKQSYEKPESLGTTKILAAEKLASQKLELLHEYPLKRDYDKQLQLFEKLPPNTDLKSTLPEILTPRWLWALAYRYRENIFSKTPIPPMRVKHIFLSSDRKLILKEEPLCEAIKRTLENKMVYAIFSDVKICTFGQQDDPIVEKILIEAERADLRTQLLFLSQDVNENAANIKKLQQHLRAPKNHVKKSAQEWAKEEELKPEDFKAALDLIKNAGVNL